MKTLQDSSEIQEAIEIFKALIADSAVVAPVIRRKKETVPIAAPQPVIQPSMKHSDPVIREVRAESQDQPGEYRGDRLENTLYTMCQRGGFQGAVLADDNGLPLAVYNSPVEDEAIAAFTTVLGDALEIAGKLLKQHDANNISMDINYTEKAVLRRFMISESPYFIMTICPQEVDERAEVELSIDQVTSILGLN